MQNNFKPDNMKNFSFIVVLLFTATFAQTNKKQEDQKAIKSMCGCHEVKFNFKETFNYSKDTLTYKPSKTKNDYGLEWVELVQDSEDKIVLQHLLIVGDTSIIKHWRQDWLFENQQLYTYNRDNIWNFNKISSKQVKGQWTQKVFQVDDSPRYEGSATWNHVDGRHFWENTTDAPLPRREYTIRKDYNVLKRTNVHEITSFGFVHDQDNDKIVRVENQKDFLLAKEKGTDVYIKVDDSKCKIAHEWWLKNEMIWKKVREKWNKVFSIDKNLSLQKKVDGKMIFEFLFDLKPTATEKEIETIIDKFVIK